MNNNNNNKNFKTKWGRGELDKLIYQNFINQKVDDGICLEIGGHDGGSLSITNFFEKELGFHCHLIEPSKKLYLKSKENRPDASHYNYAVAKNRGTLTLMSGEHGEVSGLECNMAPEWINTWGLRNKEDVQAVHMSDIIDGANPPIKYIDLWILDVEGSELDVLETMNWEVPVGVIAIEMLSILPHYSYMKEKDDKCRQFLKSKGFEHQKTLSGDEFWVNRNYFRKDILFK